MKAWELGIATMKSGEKARFYCCDSYISTFPADTGDNEMSQSTNNITTVYDIELLWWQG